MIVDEWSRHQLFRRLEEALGAEAATTLIEHLPRVGWADVATKHDLAGFEQRMDFRLAQVEGRLDERFSAPELRRGSATTCTCGSRWSTIGSPDGGFTSPSGRGSTEPWSDRHRRGGSGPDGPRGFASFQETMHEGMRDLTRMYLLIVAVVVIMSAMTLGAALST